MITNRDDDYLICKHYYNHINDVSSEFKDFVTFEHNDNHYFAWVNDGKVIMRSEAYPDHERTVRGIKAIIKNRGMQERYSIDSQHGVHFLLLWGGGDHQKHTGNLDKHNEIGRSCPVKSIGELRSMMGFMGDDLVNGIFGSAKSGKSSGAALAGASALGAAGMSKADTARSEMASTTSSVKKEKAAAVAASTKSSGGGFKWWYLLPLLLIPLFFMWKGCGGDGDTKVKAKTEVEAKKPETNQATTSLSAEEEAKIKADEEAAAKVLADEAAAKLEAEREEKEAAAAKAKKEREDRDRKAQARSYRGNKSSGF